MVKIAVIFADGMEEIEAITPVDILRRAGVTVNSVSVSGKEVKGSHGITVIADVSVEQVDFDDYDVFIIPGGMPGAVNISKNAKVIDALKSALNSGKVVGAICASPAVVLGANGLIDGKKATCYPSKDFISVLGKAYTGNAVEVFGNLVTANGPRAALDFSLAVADLLGLKPKF